MSPPWYSACPKTVAGVNCPSAENSNSKFESVRHLALNLARALARNNTASKSMIKSKKKAGRKDNTLLNLELLG
jgi:hypothetical protein